MSRYHSQSALEIDARAWRLRQQGETYQAIATILGVRSREWARRRVERYTLHLAADRHAGVFPPLLRRDPPSDSEPPGGAPASPAVAGELLLELPADTERERA